MKRYPSFNSKSLVGLLAACLAMVFGTVDKSRADFIVNGNFAAGDTGFTSTYSDYTHNPNGTNPNAFGGYDITTSPSQFPTPPSDWTTFNTPSGQPGNMMVLGTTFPYENVTPSVAYYFWQETVNVPSNTELVFSYWGATSNIYSYSPSVIQGYINGVAVGASLTLPVQSTATGGSWVQSSVTWFSGSNTTATLDLVDLNNYYYWNDWVIDDISLDPASVPEPASLTLLVIGSVVLSGRVLRRKRVGGMPA